MTDAQTRREAKAASDMEWMEAILRGPLGNSAIFEEWCAQVKAIKGWSRATFKRRLREFKAARPELKGGRWTGDPYSLATQATAAMAIVERMASGRLASANVRVELMKPRNEPTPEAHTGPRRLTEQALRHLKEQTNGSDRRT
jgi:hypothetical protein